MIYISGFGAIQANGCGVGAIGVFLSDGSSAVLLLDDFEFSEAIRTGRNYGQGVVDSIFFFNGALSNINAAGEMAVIVGMQGGGSAIYRFEANQPHNSADPHWKNTDITRIGRRYFVI